MYVPANAVSKNSAVAKRHSITHTNVRIDATRFHRREIIRSVKHTHVTQIWVTNFASADVVK